MLTLFALTLFGAVSEPSLIVNNFELTIDEGVALVQDRQRHLGELRNRMQLLVSYRDDAVATEKAMIAEANAMPEGAARTQLLTKAARIAGAAGDRMDRSVKELRELIKSLPSPQEQRKETLTLGYNRVAQIWRVDDGGDGALTRAEALYWPALVFDAVDANDDESVTLAEARAYWDGL